jgi:hypothetical protein
MKEERAIDIKKYTIHKTAEQLLLPTLRQYRHNDSDVFIKGCDYDGVIEVIENLLERSDNNCCAEIADATSHEQ